MTRPEGSAGSNPDSAARTGQATRASSGRLQSLHRHPEDLTTRTTPQQHREGNRPSGARRIRIRQQRLQCAGRTAGSPKESWKGCWQSRVGRRGFASGRPPGPEPSREPGRYSPTRARSERRSSFPRSCRRSSGIASPGLRTQLPQGITGPVADAFLRIPQRGNQQGQRRGAPSAEGREGLFHVRIRIPTRGLSILEGPLNPQQRRRARIRCRTGDGTLPAIAVSCGPVRTGDFETPPASCPGESGVSRGKNREYPTPRVRRTTEAATNTARLFAELAESQDSPKWTWMPCPRSPAQSL